MVKPSVSVLVQRFILWTATVAVVLAGLYGIWRFLSHDRQEFLDAAALLPFEKEAAKRDGLPLEPEDLARNVPDAANAAPILAKVAAKIDALHKGKPYDYESAMRAVAFDVSPKAMADARRAERDLSALWPLAAEAAGRPQLDYKRDDSQIVIDFRERSSTKQLLKYLIARSALGAQAGDVPAGLAYLEQAHRIGNLVAQEPTLIAYLVAIACHSMVLGGYDSLVSMKAGDAAALRLIEESLERLEPMVDLTHALRGEVVLGRSFLQELKTVSDFNKMVTAFDASETDEEKEKVDLTPPLGVSLDDMRNAFDYRTINWWRRLIAAVNAAGQDGVERSKAMKAVEEEELRHEGRSYALSQQLTSFSIVPLSVTRLQAKKVGIKAKIAVLILKLSKGSYPKTLDEVGEFTDPFDKKPLRYRLTDKGFLIYNVGIDLKDDGGRTTPVDRDDITRHPIPKPKKP